MVNHTEKWKWRHFCVLKARRKIFVLFFPVSMQPTTAQRNKKPQGLNFERDKDIKMIELIQNTVDHLQIIETLSFNKGCKVQNLWHLLLMAEILISTLNSHP